MLVYTNSYGAVHIRIWGAQKLNCRANILVNLPNNKSKIFSAPR